MLGVRMMGDLRMKLVVPAVAGLLLALGCATVAEAHAALTTINNPGGGKIMYGQVDGARDDASAMAAILRAIHTQCGDRPQVGKLFAVRGTGSVAVFFTVVNRSAGNTPVAGMLIAAPAGGGNVEAALVTDKAARLGSTINPMLKTLFASWHVRGSRVASAQPRPPSQQALALHRVVAGDDSASAMLPAGWTMNPVSRYGTMVVAGPHGERGVLGSALLAMDENNPRVRQTEMFAQGAGRNTSYARVLYYPYGANLADTFVTVLQRSRRNLGAPPANITVTSVADVGGRCARISGRNDRCDLLLGRRLADGSVHERHELRNRPAKLRESRPRGRRRGLEQF